MFISGMDMILFHNEEILERHFENSLKGFVFFFNLLSS